MRTKLAVVVAAAAITGLLTPALVQGTSASLDSAAPTVQLQRAVRLAPPAPPPPPPPAPASPVQVIFDLVNAERAVRGLPAMVFDPLLALAAQRHSEDQAAMRKMTHTGSDGSSLSQRVDRVGFAWRSLAENVAVGYAGPAAVMAAWMNSDGHRRNILSANTHLGVGLAYGSDGRPYWTQVFGTPR
ncbi:MAG TPA: CAP domain-containing protein [Ilumatobacteraceae bacterium]|nr:CAP domain-containing protein [Ilumatobacteraceae bacterium]